jgi:hypothetical protein
MGIKTRHKNPASIPKDIYLNFIISRQTLRPAHPSIQRTPGEGGCSCLLAVMLSEIEGNHSRSANTKVRNEWNYTSVPHMHSKLAQGQFTFTFTFTRHS